MLVRSRTLRDTDKVIVGSGILDSAKGLASLTRSRICTTMSSRRARRPLPCRFWWAKDGPAGAWVLERGQGRCSRCPSTRLATSRSQSCRAGECSHTLSLLFLLYLTPDRILSHRTVSTSYTKASPLFDSSTGSRFVGSLAIYICLVAKRTHTHTCKELI